MTATDELRKLLDERGVEYEVDHGYHEYFWDFGEHGRARASYIGTKGLVQMIVTGLTPEQAIAATLGNGTCRSTTPDDAWCFGCSECGKSFPRDELHLAHNHGEINYCPNCGRKVKR